jgi:hypothetical protein
VFEDGPPAGAFAKLFVHARGEGWPSVAVPVSGTTLSLQAGRVLEDGTFQIGGILGASRLAVSGQPTGWVIRSITYRGREIADTPVDFESSGDTHFLNIVLTNRVARVVGRVVATGVRPRIVVLITADRARWSSRGAVVAMTGLRDEGTFELPPVLPGAYYLVATASMNWLVDSGPSFPAAIDTLTAEGTALTLAEGEKRAVTLQVATVR